MESLSLVILHQRFQFIHKAPDILEFPVHGSKAHIGYLVQTFQLIHHQIADFH